MFKHVKDFTAEEVKSLLGIGPVEFAHITKRVWENSPDSHLGRPHKHSFTTRLFITLLHVRTNLTERQLVALFDLSPSNIHETVTRSEEAISLLFPHLERLDKRYLYVVDGTTIPAPDRSKTAKSKNYRRSIR